MDTLSLRERLRLTPLISRTEMQFREKDLRDHSLLRDPGAVPRENLVVVQVPAATVPSYSPGIARGLYSKKDKETKPAAWGVIGVCTLDVKARSKPSRNILNRLISKGGSGHGNSNYCEVWSKSLWV